jgi:hypothetical protein
MTKLATRTTAKKTAHKKPVGKTTTRAAGKKAKTSVTAARKAAASQTAPRKTAASKTPASKKGAGKTTARKAAASKAQSSKAEPSKAGARKPARTRAKKTVKKAEAAAPDVVAKSASSEAYSVTTRQPARAQLAQDVERFLADGGTVKEIPRHHRADPPRRPENSYGRGSI